MMKSYFKSKVKISLLVFTMIFLVLGMITLNIAYAVKTASKMGYGSITGGCLVALFISIAKIKPQYKQCININLDNFIFYNCFDKFHNPPCVVTVKFVDIMEIKYSGTKLIPMFEVMTIKTKNDTVWLDFNFHNYLALWNEIIVKCRETNTNIKIDPKILNRLNFRD